MQRENVAIRAAEDGTESESAFSDRDTPQLLYSTLTSDILSSNFVERLELRHRLCTHYFFVRHALSARIVPSFLRTSDYARHRMIVYANCNRTALPITRPYIAGLSSMAAVTLKVPLFPVLTNVYCAMTLGQFLLHLARESSANVIGQQRDPKTRNAQGHPRRYARSSGADERWSGAHIHISVCIQIRRRDR